MDPALSRISLSEWATTWFASKAGLKPTTRSNYEQLWRLHVEPRWGSVPLRAVSYAEVVTWTAELTGAGLSPSWVRQALLCVKQMLDLAVLDGRIARNPAKQVKAPRLRKSEPRYLTHDQLAVLAGECGQRGEQHRLLVLLAGYTGLRWGELRAVRVKRLDTVRCRVDVASNIPDGYGETDEVTPKSHKRRVVPFPRFLAEDLAALVTGRRPPDLVFRSGAEGLLDNSNWRRQIFDPAARALGLDPLTPHQLRDTAASLAVSAGASVKSVQRMLGHASAAMTLDVYAGLFSDDLDAVAVRLNGAALAAAEARLRPPTAEASGRYSEQAL